MRTEVPWWKKTTVYQIFPKSFKDTNQDGIGDLEGIIKKLDYLKELGIETIWLNPIYSSPDKDAGYDISNFKDISPKFGDMKVCRELIQEVHSRDMKIIFDMVLNHTSDQHPWFLESRSSKENPKRDWYIWRNGAKPGGKKPPNNWRSLLSGKSGWHYDKTTDQWYWAHFFSFQPDLNYWNAQVREKMINVIRFWLEEGIDGFRLDFINGIFHDNKFRDNPFKFKLIPSSLAPEMLFQGSKYTLDRPETLSFMKTLRSLVDQYDPPRFLIGEATTSPKILRKYCGEKNYDGLHMVFLFVGLSIPLKARKIRNMIEEYEYVFPDPYIPTWVFSTHDRMRRITRLLNDFNKAKINAILQLTARGVPFIYYGEEIGIPQHYLPAENSNDPVAQNYKWVPQFLLKITRKFFHESVNREECRTPMQWDSTTNAGFCSPSVKPWLPITQTNTVINVKKEAEDPNSLYSCYKKLLHIRKKFIALQEGALKFKDWKQIPKSVLAYERIIKLEEDKLSCLEVFLNLSSKKVVFNATHDARNLIYSSEASTNPISKGEIQLLPYEGIITNLKK